MLLTCNPLIGQFVHPTGGDEVRGIEGGNYYLSPLSAIQVSASTLKTLIEENKERIKNVLIDGEKKGEGFEYKAEMSVSKEEEGINKLTYFYDFKISNFE